MNLESLALALRRASGLAHKRDLDPLLTSLASAAPPGEGWLPNGDDCAAIPDGDGHLLLAIEGFQSAFVARDPWFAGWCGVMVNLSDIAAMGGRPLAVVDAVWSRDGDRALRVLDGMAAASRTYGVPVAGGHANTRSDGEQLAVSVLGRAKTLITSFDARAGDRLVAAIDLRGRYREPFPHWDAASDADPAQLRGDLATLPDIAEAGWCRAGKDVSQAGILGTLLMLLECSGVGARIDVGHVPAPDGADLERWLTAAFPSFGFLLAVPPSFVGDVLRRFDARGIAAADIGRCDGTPTLRLAARDREHVAWDLRRDRVLGRGRGFSDSSGDRAQGPQRETPAHA